MEESSAEVASLVPGDPDDGALSATSSYNMSAIPTDNVLTGEQRNDLYEKGKQFLSNKKLSNALDCFLTCIGDLTPKSGFSYLPQCLRKISEIYYGMEDYSRAVQFLQVEKMYYETALIDSPGMQQLLADKGSQIVDDVGTSAGAEDPLKAKAHEYERLSQLCLKQDRPELALEFCGKATQLYQKIYGDRHPTTSKALDSFTLIYAEVGKRQYSDTVKKYKATEVQSADDEAATRTKSSTEVTQGFDKVRNSSESRQDHRGANDEADIVQPKLIQERDRAKHSITPEEEAESEMTERREDHVPPPDDGRGASQRGEAVTREGRAHPLIAGLLLLMVVWVVFALGLVALAAICESAEPADFCSTVQSRLRYWYLVAKYYYKQYRS